MQEFDQSMNNMVESNRRLQSNLHDSMVSCGEVLVKDPRIGTALGSILIIVGLILAFINDQLNQHGFYVFIPGAFLLFVFLPRLLIMFCRVDLHSTLRISLIISLCCASISLILVLYPQITGTIPFTNSTPSRFSLTQQCLLDGAFSAHISISILGFLLSISYTATERAIAGYVLATLIVGVSGTGVVFYYFFYQPIETYSESIILWLKLEHILFPIAFFSLLGVATVVSLWSQHYHLF